MSNKPILLLFNPPIFSRGQFRAPGRSKYGGRNRELIREYQDGKITRREFMHKAIAITGSLVAAGSLIDSSGFVPLPRSIPMIQRFFAMTLSIREEPRVFTAIWPVLPHWGNFPRSSLSIRTKV